MRIGKILRTVTVVLAVRMAAGAEEGIEPHREREYKLDWYGWAEVAASPMMSSPGWFDPVQLMADGSEHSGWAECSGGPETGAEITFDFPEEVGLAAVELQLRGCRSFRIDVDRSGSRSYEDNGVRVVAESDFTADEVVRIPLRRNVRGLRFVFLDGTVGYRVAFPQIGELRLFTSAHVKTSRPPERSRFLISDFFAPSEEPAPGQNDGDGIEITYCADAWMGGLVWDGRNLPDDLGAFEPFQNMIRQIRYLRGNSVRAFFEVNGCENRLPWPSATGFGLEKNLMKAFTDELRKHRLPVYYFAHAWTSPMQSEPLGPMPQRRWDYPYEQSDRVRIRAGADKLYPHTYPCIISDNHFHDTWTATLREAREVGGVDGFFYVPDEYYYKGHMLGGHTRCAACQQAFQERYGYDSLPEAPADTVKYRKWKLFEYERIASLFASMATNLHHAYPSAPLINMECWPKNIIYNRRLEHGLCKDMALEAVPPYVHFYAGSHPLLARRTDYLKRAKHRKTMGFSGSFYQVLHSGQVWARPVAVTGTMVAEAMNGAEMIELYRLERIFNRGWAPTVRKSAEMIRILEAWGLRQSRRPADVCVLLSRASEDWYELKYASLLGDTNDNNRGEVLFQENRERFGTVTDKGDIRRRLACEAYRGHYSHQLTEGALYAKGIPYDARWSDQPHTLADLGTYAVIVIPFSYSMSRQTFAEVRKAVAGGTRVLVYDQLAPTDEFGQAYPEPLLKPLVGEANVSHISVNVAREGMKASFKSDLIRRIREAGGARGYSFEDHGRNIEYLVRQTDHGAFLLSLANWDTTRSCEPLIGLPADAQTFYRVSSASNMRDEIMIARKNDRAEIKGSELTAFSVRLLNGEVKLLRVAPVPPRSNPPGPGG